MNHRHLHLSFAIVALFGMLLYIPFLGEPVLRTGGDEKVYIAQALEMAKRGSWFIQTLADKPDYYKGPLHYILLRIGFYLFGTKSLWAILWGNFLAVMIAALSVQLMTFKHLRNKSLAMTLAMATLASAGIYSYVFTSQMEIELLGMYALTLLLLDIWRDTRKKFLLGTLLWTMIGLAGWLKSPLYSALLGAGVFTAAAVDKKTRRKQLSIEGLASVGMGVFVGVLGYAIPWILDREAFFRTYILRETASKGGNEVSVWESVLPNLTFNLAPFMPLAILGLFYSIKILVYSHSNTITTVQERRAQELLILPFAMSLPTLLFFAIHPYRSAIYTLPCIPAVLLFSAFGLEQAKTLRPRLTLFLSCLVPILAALIPLLIALIGAKFGQHTPWWPQWLTIGGFLVSIFTLLSVIFLFRKKIPAWHPYLLATLPSLVMGGFCMTVIGRAELHGLKEYASQRGGSHPHLTFGYFNLQNNLWSEWGALNVLSGETVIGLHDQKSLLNAFSQGMPVIVPSRKYLDQMISAVGPAEEMEIYPWPRWQSHANDSVKRGPLIAWQTGNLNVLQSEAYIVTKKRHFSQASNQHFE